MRYLLGSIVGAVVALAQPSAVLDDLEHRAVLALNSIQRAESWQAAQRSRTNLQAQLEHALGFDRTPPGKPVSVFIYAPKTTSDRVPAVIILRSHTDPVEAAARLLPTALAQLGMFVIELDERSNHSTLDLLGEGVTPQGLMQRDVRSVLAYLKGNTGVDSKRIAVVGEGLAATIAFAINPDVSAGVVLNGAPDFALMIKELRALKNELPDSCILVPGTLRYAASQELLSLIMPRPLLLMNAADGPLRYALDLYGMGGAGASMYHVAENAWTSTAHYRTYAWLVRHLQHRPDLADFVPPDKGDEPLARQLPSLEQSQQSTERVQVSEHSLSASYGAPLPEGRFTYGLNCRSGPSIYDLSGNHMVHFYPQTGINMPVTVLRPGPTGCDAARGTLIAVNDRGRSELVNDEIVQEANRRGWIVWMLDPRSIGEMATQSEPFTSAVSLLLGEHISWRQASDILRTLRHVGGVSSRNPTAIYARGRVMGLAASYVAAIADRRELEWTVLRDAASSFREMTDSPLELLPFAALRSFDISDLWKTSRGSVYLIHSPEEFIRREW
jgi:hypothetical protein